MKDILCECGHAPEKHYWGGCVECDKTNGDCDKDIHDVYKAHIASRDALIGAGGRLRFICPNCNRVTFDVPTQDNILRDKFILECEYCFHCTVVRFEP